MNIDFKYKIVEINYREGIITVEYSRSNDSESSVTVSHVIPVVNKRYLSGTDLEQFVIQNFPAHAFEVIPDNDSDDSMVVEDNIEYDNTQLKFEGEGVYSSDVIHYSNFQEVKEDHNYINNIKENFSIGSGADNTQLKRAVIKILEELNIIK